MQFDHVSFWFYNMQMTEHSEMKIAWDKLRNKFHFSEVHRHMNALAHVQSNSAITLTLHGTHCSHSSMNLRKKLKSFFISSPEPWGSQGELIVYPYSGIRCHRRCRRRRQQCLNISSETALPIKAKFYVEPPWEGGKKVYINGLGHMTKMAAMPIYGKNL